MKTINPSPEAIKRFTQEAVDNKAIVMVNVLRFKEFADYGDGVVKNLSGREAYARYSKSVMPLLWEVGGQVLWRGDVRSTFIAPNDEQWDEVLLVQYPNRQAFIRMISSSAYQETMLHRTAAVADSRLIETKSLHLPKMVLKLARRVVRVKRLVMPLIK
ncbi:DUF1330 domain-containing protein [Moraxellaceae bacterium AER2_44_116]|jgi:uncharacterized protein (DUF1330 family)|nr:DUF1330 domain-containing protein [Moraxellaceae bacterium]TQC99327.1 DUF1330 domain-containing protein [Moraxellaceae bacterium AER2_44_116]